MTSFMPFIHCYNYLLWLCLNTFWNICYGPVGFPVIVAVAVVVLIFYSLFVCVLCLRLFFCVCVCVFFRGVLCFIYSLWKFLSNPLTSLSASLSTFFLNSKLSVIENFEVNLRFQVLFFF